MCVWFKENGDHSFMVTLQLSRIFNTTGSWIYWPCPENNKIIVTEIVTLSSSSSVVFNLSILCAGFYPVILSWVFLIYHSLSLLYVFLIPFLVFPIFFSPQVELQILVLFSSPAILHFFSLSSSTKIIFKISLIVVFHILLF